MSDTVKTHSRAYNVHILDFMLNVCSHTSRHGGCVFGILGCAYKDGDRCLHPFHPDNKPLEEFVLEEL